MNIDENLNDPYEMIAQEKPSSKRSRSKKSTENLTQGSKSRKEALKFCSPTDGNRKISCSSDGSKETEPLILPLRTDSQLSAGKISIETAPIDSENVIPTKVNLCFPLWLCGFLYLTFSTKIFTDSLTLLAY